MGCISAFVRRFDECDCVTFIVIIAVRMQPLGETSTNCRLHLLHKNGCAFEACTFPQLREFNANVAELVLITRWFNPNLVSN